MRTMTNPEMEKLNRDVPHVLSTMLGVAPNSAAGREISSGKQVIVETRAGLARLTFERITRSAPRSRSVYAGWLFIRFDDVPRARAHFSDVDNLTPGDSPARLNPHSGKWNWSFADDIEAAYAIRALRKIEPRLNSAGGHEADAYPNAAQDAAR